VVLDRGIRREEEIWEKGRRVAPNLSEENGGSWGGKRGQQGIVGEFRRGSGDTVSKPCPRCDLGIWRGKSEGNHGKLFTGGPEWSPACGCQGNSKPIIMQFSAVSPRGGDGGLGGIQLKA